jgi:hypothetical protein
MSASLLVEIEDEIGIKAQRLEHALLGKGQATVS